MEKLEILDRKVCAFLSMLFFLFLVFFVHSTSLGDDGVLVRCVFLCCWFEGGC